MITLLEFRDTFLKSKLKADIKYPEGCKKVLRKIINSYRLVFPTMGEFEICSFIQEMINDNINVDEFVDFLKEKFKGTEHEEEIWNKDPKMLPRFLKIHLESLQYHMILGNICMKEDRILPPCNPAFIKRLIPNLKKIPDHCVRDEDADDIINRFIGKGNRYVFSNYIGTWI